MITKTGFRLTIRGEGQHHRNEVGIGAFYWSGGGFSVTFGFWTVSLGLGDLDYDRYYGLGFSRVFSEDGNFWEGYFRG